MFKYCLFIVLSLFSGLSRAQLNDPFTDGDITSNPSWTGDVQNFTVNTAKQLQLNSQGESTSSIATSINWPGEMEWRCWVKMPFSPSDNNNTKIYLLSDQQNLEGPLNGYFIKLGESGTEDAIELVRQNGTTLKSICRGSNGLISNAFSIGIKVLYTPGGIWKVFADTQGAGEYLPEAEGSDLVVQPGSWFGISCKYTSSNSTKFCFDDVYAGPEFLDITPPVLESLSITGSHTLLLKFSEGISSTTALNLGNYQVDRGIGCPATAQQAELDLSAITLTFQEELYPDVSYSLSVSLLNDLSGNTMTPVLQAFSWHDPQSYELLITEIMCDPEPIVHLPAVEYLELFNNSDSPVDLSGWSLVVGATIKEFPAFILDAGAYVIVTEESARPFLEPFGKVISFSSFYLTNSGMSLTLRSPRQKVIFRVEYTDKWYRSDYKQEGGWSLEMIDIHNPCGGSSNWLASVDNSGGTPGRINSVDGMNPDHESPRISSTGILDPLHVLITFNESMDTSTILNRIAYHIEPGMGSPQSVTVPSISASQIILELAAIMQEGVIYTLTFPGELADCAGNILAEGSSKRLALPAEPEPDDLIINEILFNPAEGCVDFIEIYNRSLKTIDLQDVAFAEYDTISKLTADVSEACQESTLAFPGEYYAFSVDTSALRECYHTACQEGLIEVEDIPAMANEAGSIALISKAGTLIDQVNYQASMHYPLLTSEEGVSLERINPNGNSGDPLNWHSAGASCGYATPACKNSQFNAGNSDPSDISVMPLIISPDNDGVDDVLNISYCFDKPGNNATVKVFNVNGILIRSLVSNILCGTSGSWTWDGMDDQRLKAPIGRYILFVEVFNLDGKVERMKKTVVVGGKLQ